MSNLIQGTHHLCLKCGGAEAFERTIRFYRDVLGLTVAHQWNGGIMLSTGDAMLEIFDNADDAPAQGAIRHFALATSDVDACAKACADAGYEVFVQPKDIAFPTAEPFRARIAFCRGPVGEEIEFFSEK